MPVPDRVRLPLSFDPEGLQRDLAHAAQSAKWQRHYSRQDYDGDWSVVPLRAPAYAMHRVNLIYADPFATDFKDLPLLAECPHFSAVVAAFQAPVRGVRLMRLAPGAVIKEHIDRGASFEDGLARVHIAVTTNDEVDFRINGERLVLEPGSAWLVKIADPHSVANRGQTDRVHLVLDIAVNDWLRDLVRSLVPETENPMHADDTPLADVPVLETPRLVLRALRRSDFAAVLELWSDPRTVALMGMKPMNEEDAWAKFLRSVGSWHVNGFGFWAIEEKASGRFAGELGFLNAKRTFDPALPVPEIGWSLMPWAKGNGYASEALGTALTWGELHFGRVRFSAIIAPENVPSLKLAHKFGFVDVAETTYKEHPIIVLHRD
jgi:RimJ/RimL family protein N-acetyltransferase